MNPFVMSSYVSKPLGWNITEFKLDVFGWFFVPFKIYLGDFVYILMFAALFTMMYNENHKVLPLLFSILLTFAMFGANKILIDETQYMLFWSIIAILSIVGIIMSVFVRRVL